MVLSPSPKTSPSFLSAHRPCQGSPFREQQVAPFLLTRAKPTPEIPNLLHMAPRSWPVVFYYEAVTLSPTEPPHFRPGLGKFCRPSAARAAYGMAAPGYGPGAGSRGVPSPEESTCDAGRISLEFRGAPESSQDARRSNTRLERAPSTPPRPAAGSSPPAPVSAKGPRERVGSGPGTPRGGSRRGKGAPGTSSRRLLPPGP